MPQSYPDGTIIDGPNGPMVRSGGRWMPMGAPVAAAPPTIVTKRADPKQPYEIAKLQSETDPTTLKASRDKAVADAEKARAEADKAVADASNNGPNNPNTATVRAQALQAFEAAKLLDKQIGDMRTAFAAGPGKTSGLSGLKDFLPTQANRAFDQAANAARGAIGATLGFTGGQLNTATEAQMNVGPYLPSSADYDENARAKIDRLAELRDKAIRQAVQVLGGVPDANGVVTPVAKGADPVALALGPKKDDKSVAIGLGASPPGGTGSGPAPFAGPGPVAPVSASGSAGQTVTGTGINSVPNPEGAAIFKNVVGLFGSGASDDRIREYARNVYGGDNADIEAALKARSQGKKINFYPGDNLLTKPVANDGVMGALADTLVNSPVATNIAEAGNSAGAGLPQEVAARLSGNPDLARARFQAARENNPSSVIGSIAGGALGAAGLEGLAARGAARFAPRLAPLAPLAADVGYGATAGATGNPENPVSGALWGGLAGGIGGVAGRGIAGGIGGAATGVRNEAVRELQARGIKMTGGQMLGGSGVVGNMVKGLEDRMSGIPVAGDLINARRGEGLADFNRAAFNDALKPIGVPGTGQIGEAGIADAQDAVSGAYKSALGGRSATIDPQYGAAEASVLSKAGAIPRVGPEVVDGLDNAVQPYFSPSGDMSGENMQAALADVGKFGRGYKNDPLGSRVKGAAGGMRDAITGMFERQQPDVIPQFRAANEAYGNLSTLEDAVLKGINTDGTFMPSQLNMAARANAANYGGKKAAAAGDRAFSDLARAGQQVLPSKIPDSGTAGRIAALALPGAIGGGGGAIYDGATGSDSGASLGLAGGLALSGIAAGNTRIGRAAFEKLLLDRPDLAVAIGNQIKGRQAIAGSIGVPLALGYNSQ